MKTRDTYSKLSSAPIPPPPLQEYVLVGAGPWKEGIKAQTFFLHTDNLSNESYDVFMSKGICDIVTTLTLCTCFHIGDILVEI